MRLETEIFWTLIFGTLDWLLLVLLVFSEFAHY